MSTYNYEPKTITQKKTLEKLISEFKKTNTILTGTYDKIIGKTYVTFKCGKCDKNGSKCVNQINVSGGICHECTQNIRMKKQEVTMIKNHGVKNISQKTEIKAKKESTAFKNGFRYTKEKWLDKIKLKGLDEIWEYTFDIIDGYDKPHPMKHIKCGIISEKSPRHHLLNDSVETPGQGCLYCYHNSHRLTKQDFEKKGIERFGGDYFKYTNVPEIIDNNHTKITIICCDHGSFETSYPTHLYGNGGCLPCSNNIKTKREIVELYLEEIETNGVILNLDKYEDKSIITSNEIISCRCKNNPNHQDWEALLSNLIKGSGCPNIDCVNFKITNTNIKRYGVSCALQLAHAREAMSKAHIENKESILASRKSTCFKNYGVEHPLQSLEIQKKMQKSSYSYKDYITPSKKILRIQGFENKALDELLKIYSEEDIITDRSDIPIILWDDTRRYFPDILIKSKNKFIEVKSTWTFEKQKEETLKKAKACVDYKYDIEIWIYDNKNNKTILNTF
jgi:hypothetical protein